MKERTVSVNGASVGGGKSGFLHRHKKMILTALAVFILIIFSFSLGYVIWQSKFSEPEGICSQNMLEDSGKKISSNTTNQLVATVKQIQDTPGHETDPNCLYVLTKYYIDVTDADNASKYYKLLDKVYNSELGFDPALGKAVLSMSQLKSQVTFIQQLTNNAPSASLENQVQQ